MVLKIRNSYDNSWDIIDNIKSIKKYDEDKFYFKNLKEITNSEGIPDLSNLIITRKGCPEGNFQYDNIYYPDKDKCTYEKLNKMFMKVIFVSFINETYKYIIFFNNAFACNDSGKTIERL